jgi:transglutaminase-like putative cysteine protease
VILEVQQEYRYAYTAAVSNLHQRLIMVPPDVHLDQRLLSFELAVRGLDAGQFQLTWQSDSFGNRIACVDAPAVGRSIAFVARYRVERGVALDASLPKGSKGGPTPVAPLVGDEFLEATALTAPDDRLRAVAHDIQARAGDERERAELSHTWAATAILFKVGVTGVQTPAAMALHLGKGVCQDYAHLLLCVLRQLNIPARYVSGQLMGEGATHAWVEALVDGELIAFDPTHARRARPDYVTVAVGRDYADVAPTSGVFSGTASGRLTAAKNTRIAQAVA